MLDLLKPADPNVSRETLTHLPIGEVTDNPWQYRIDYGGLDELAADIQRNGLLQPPIARRQPDGTVQIAFGHRRLRACLQAGLALFPVFLHALTDEQMSEYAWSENEQRSETSDVEKARHIQKEMDDFGWTQTQAAERHGMSRPAVANLLRLLGLPEEVQERIVRREMAPTHGRTLLALADAPDVQARIAADAVAQGLTTREVEAEVAVQRERIDREKEIARQLAAVESTGLHVPFLEKTDGQCSFFRESDYWADAVLLDAGVCGPDRCDCLRLAWKNDPSDTMARPFAQGAPNLCYMCSNDKQCRNKFTEWRDAQKLTRMTDPAVAAQAKAEEEAKAAAAQAERERRQAVADDLVQSVIDRYSLALLWVDMRFWRFVILRLGYRLQFPLLESASLEEAQRALLVASLVVEKWDREIGETINLEATGQNRADLFKAMGTQAAD